MKKSVQTLLAVLILLQSIPAVANPATGALPTTLLAQAQGVADVPNALNPESLEQADNLQQLISNAISHPDWFAAVGGMSVFFFMLGELSKFAINDLPTAWFAATRIYLTSSATRYGEKVIKELPDLLAHYRSDALHLQHAIHRMDQAREVIVTGTGRQHTWMNSSAPLRKNLAKLSTSQQVHELQHNRAIRAQLEKTIKGKVLLRHFDRMVERHLEAEQKAIQTFEQTAEKLIRFSKLLNSAAEGWLGDLKLYEREPRVSLRPSQNSSEGQAGDLIHTHNSGFSDRVRHMEKLPDLLKPLAVDCEVHTAALGKANRGNWKIVREKLMKLGAISVIGGVALAVSRGANQRIEKQTKVPTKTLIEDNKKQKAAQALKEALAGMNPREISKMLAAWRTDPKQPAGEKVMDLLAAEIRKTLPTLSKELQAGLRGHRNTSKMDAELKDILANDDTLMGIVELTLADTMAAHGISTPAELEDILLSDPGNAKKMVELNGFLCNLIGIIPKKVWPTIVADVSAFPISASTKDAFAIDTKVSLEKLRGELKVAGILDPTVNQVASAPVGNASPVPASAGALQKLNP